MPTQGRVTYVGAVGAFLVVVSTAAWAQQPLTLDDAIRIAGGSSPVIQAAAARRGSAAEGERHARSGYWPRVSVGESFRRGDLPVYAFGSLLNQRRFTEQDFDVDALNNPSPINNFQSQLVVEQTLFDGFRTRSADRVAESRVAIASEAGRGARASVIRAVAETYFGAVMAAETAVVAAEAVRTAEADLDRAPSMFETGMTTEADVLSVRVYLARVREEQIRARYARTVARAALNDAMGVDLDTEFDLVTPLTMPLASIGDVASYERSAVERHPDLGQAVLGLRAAEHQTDLAKSTRWPQVVAQGVVESNRTSLARLRGVNWMGSVGARWTLWDGSAARADVARARHAVTEAEAHRRRVESAVRLGVRRVFANLAAAAERVAVATAAVEAAEASHRIIQDRYEAGLTIVTELIRSETALLEAHVRRLAALHDRRVAAVRLEEAAGTLTSDSALLR